MSGRPPQIPRGKDNDPIQSLLDQCDQVERRWKGGDKRAFKPSVPYAGASTCASSGSNRESEEPPGHTDGRIAIANSDGGGWGDELREGTIEMADALQEARAALLEARLLMAEPSADAKVVADVSDTGGQGDDSRALLERARRKLLADDVASSPGMCCPPQVPHEDIDSGKTATRALPRKQSGGAGTAYGAPHNGSEGRRPARSSQLHRSGSSSREGTPSRSRPSSSSSQRRQDVGSATARCPQRPPEASTAGSSKAIPDSSESGTASAAETMKPYPPVVRRRSDLQKSRSGPKSPKHVVSAGKRWKVVGGSEKGGIIVREGRELSSKEKTQRLGHGTLVEEEELVGERLRYSRLAGSGPDSGWVSITLKDKELMVRVIGQEHAVGRRSPSAEPDRSSSRPASARRRAQSEQAPRYRDANSNASAISEDSERLEVAAHQKKLPCVHTPRSAPPLIGSKGDDGQMRLPEITPRVRLNGSG